MEDGSIGGLPTKQDEEFRPFIRRLPEFKFWESATRAITIGFACTWFVIFDVPVFWPVLVVYWLILFTLTSKYSNFFVVCAGFGRWGNALDGRWRGANPCVKSRVASFESSANQIVAIVRRQIQHMIKYRYVPFTFGKAKYNKNSS